jgi:predicted acetyltransferase
MNPWNGNDLALIRPALTLREEFISFCREFPPATSIPGMGCLNPDDCEASIQVERLHAQGERLPTGWVPSRTYWLVRDHSTIIGTINLRSVLTPALLAGSGHIGFSVRPTCRGQGFAGVMLRGCLKIAKADGMERVLVTCDRSNIASARVIERCGGQLENEVELLGNPGSLTRRYWINLEGEPRGD